MGHYLQDMTDWRPDGKHCGECGQELQFSMAAGTYIEHNHSDPKPWNAAINQLTEEMYDIDRAYPWDYCMCCGIGRNPQRKKKSVQLVDGKCPECGRTKLEISEFMCDLYPGG